MHPILVEWGSFVLPAWHTFYVLGAFAAFFLLNILRQTFYPELPPLELLFVLCYCGGYLGARLLSIIVEEPQTPLIEGLLGLGPMTFYGGAIGAGVAGLIWAVTTKTSIPKILDLAIPAALLALSLGRIGCFLNGDDYGMIYRQNDWPSLFTAVFPNLGDNAPRIVVQLIESIAVAFISGGLILFFSKIRRSLGAGGVGLSGILAYANLRFFLEFLRDDFRGSVWFSWLSTSQFISLWLVALAGGFLIPKIFMKQSRRGTDKPK